MSSVNQFHGTEFDNRKKKLAMALAMSERAPEPKDSYRNKSESREHARQMFFDLYRSETIRCADCGEDKRLEIHHRDGDPYNNNWKNLVGLCRDCHQRRHYANTDD